MILAKREGKAFQTLKGHTYDALKIYKEYLERNFDVVDDFCNRWEIPTEKFIRNIFFQGAVYKKKILLCIFVNTVFFYKSFHLFVSIRWTKI